MKPVARLRRGRWIGERGPDGPLSCWAFPCARVGPPWGERGRRRPKTRHCREKTPANAAGQHILWAARPAALRRDGPQKQPEPGRSSSRPLKKSAVATPVPKWADFLSALVELRKSARARHRRSRREMIFEILFQRPARVPPRSRGGSGPRDGEGAANSAPYTAGQNPGRALHEGPAEPPVPPQRPDAPRHWRNAQRGFPCQHVVNFSPVPRHF
jgi:hypothetical protein